MDIRKPPCRLAGGSVQCFCWVKFFMFVGCSILKALFQNRNDFFFGRTPQSEYRKVFPKSISIFSQKLFQHGSHLISDHSTYLRTLYKNREDISEQPQDFQNQKPQNPPFQQRLPWQASNRHVSNIRSHVLNQLVFSPLSHLPLYQTSQLLQMGSAPGFHLQQLYKPLILNTLALHQSSCRTS